MSSKWAITTLPFITLNLLLVLYLSHFFMAFVFRSFWMYQFQSITFFLLSLLIPFSYSFFLSVCISLFLYLCLSLCFLSLYFSFNPSASYVYFILSLFLAVNFLNHTLCPSEPLSLYLCPSFNYSRFVTSCLHTFLILLSHSLFSSSTYFFLSLMPFHSLTNKKE